MKVQSPPLLHTPRPQLEGAPDKAQGPKRPTGPLRAPGLSARAAVQLPAPSDHAPPRAGLRKARIDHLTAGKRFDVSSTKALEAITGHALSLDGLSRLYEKALPSSRMMANTRVRITGSAQKGHFAFTVTYVDNLQRRVATARRRLIQHEDGSLELYRHGTWVDPELRGRGFSAHMLRQELSLMTALSDHPATRLTLWAGGARNPKRSDDLQNVGVYVWAKAGFEVATTPSVLAMGGDKPRCEDDPGREVLGDLDLIKRQFVRWLDAQVAQGNLPKSEAKAAQQAASKFEYPFEFAQLSPPGRSFTAQVGQVQRACGMGQAFLLSPLSPRWEGALRVHQRGPSMARAEAYIAENQGREGRGDEAVSQAWLQQLQSADPEVQKQALLQIGALGGTGFVEPLMALSQKQPELADAVRQTLLKVRGRYKPPRTKITYSTHGGQARVFSLPNQYADLERLSAARLAAIAVSDDDHRRAQAALQQLAAQHLDKVPQTVLEASHKLYARFPDDERWLARQSAVQILSKLPNELGMPALIEASKTEDDINIMVAIHRALDQAEHPGAVEPAEALGVRIEEMKAEIEKALAELG